MSSWHNKWERSLTWCKGWYFRKKIDIFRIFSYKSLAFDLCDTPQAGERLKLYKEKKYAIKSIEYLVWYFCEKYLSWLSFIYLTLYVAFLCMQQPHFHIIMSLNIINFPQALQNFYEILVLLKCRKRGNSSPSDGRARFIKAGTNTMQDTQFRPVYLNDLLSF